MHKDEELILIQSSQKGDIKAYGKLATKYQDMIFTLAVRMLKNRQDAEDLCQEVLIKIFKCISQYQSFSAFGAWVYRISYNECLNRIRKDKRNRETYDVSVNEKENWTETTNVLDSIEAQEKKAIIINALDELSEDDRFIIMAYYFEELPIKDICEITDLTESNIKVKLHRSRKQLYRILKNPQLKENLI